MKYLIIFFFSLFILSCNINNKEEAVEVENLLIEIDEFAGLSEKENTSQDDDESRTDEDIITEIKKKFKIINYHIKNGSYQIDSTNYKCPDYPEYGLIKYFTNDIGVYMIEHSYNEGDHGGATDQFYIWEGELFFVFSDGGYWTFGGGEIDEHGSSPTIDYMTEKRFYLEKERVVKCLEKKFEIRSASKNNPKSNEVSNKEIVAPETEVKELLNQYEKLFHYSSKTDDCLWTNDDTE